ncbi:putative succinyl-diaminopimelate desuccinylase [Oxobacter pfennigii]|uniref:Putative succinyl-diaminopimelate desuccinylase n=1 Tax=Oxobacter pfennigii TaxID=36849 RepID=A0A0P8WX15_9CLOT|nr:M20/M25/M40 family metallo-hydrolase [Oxobacter pfennigii]KPU42829.1 putative succinyl-diaminopimelate desuccinylase [Oxobacter pfennigii]
MDLSSNILNTLNRLCNIKSTSGTVEETLAAREIYSIISEIGYFKKHNENLILHDIKNDPFERKYITAMLKMGNSKKLTVLLSHFDVVGIEEFGNLKEYAYTPLEYTDRLKYEALPQKAKDDLDTDDWLFGRGTMDMKCGLAIHIEIMRYLYENNIELDGGILLLTVPDEENSSAGMLSAVNYLSELKDEGYEIKGVINCEPYFPEHPDDDNKYIYTGTIGKLLPFIFFAGLETHCGEPFNGISASLLSSMTTSLMEANLDLCDTYEGYTAPPPVCLKQQDLKSLYSVSTPNFSYAYYNYFTLNSTPEEVLSKVKALCHKAFELSIEKMQSHEIKYAELTKHKKAGLNIKPTILFYEELLSMIEKKGISVEIIKEKYKDTGMDTRDMTSHIISDMLKCIPELRPVIVVSLAPPYYPHRKADNDFKNILDISKKLIDMSNEEFSEDLIHRDFFPGLCDLSYLGFDNPYNYFTLKSNMPVMDVSYTLPITALNNINIGGINIGVMGKDVHKYTERLNMPYSFKVTPHLVLCAVKEFLK